MTGIAWDLAGMKAPDLIAANHEQRLHAIVNQSWTIFQSHFVGGRHPILKEAPFQHHFATIISRVGELYCTHRDDVFLVDLEVKFENTSGQKRFLDIACSFENANVSCAIELKFKTAQQGAQKFGRIDAYADIEAVERACRRKYKFGRFYMITDSPVYVRPSKHGAGTIFCLHDGFQAEPGMRTCHARRQRVQVTLTKPYRFGWTEIDKWYFLEVRI